MTFDEWWKSHDIPATPNYYGGQMTDIIDLMLENVRPKGLNTAICRRKDGVWVIAVHPDEKDIMGTLQAATLHICGKEMPIIDVTDEEED